MLRRGRGLGVECGVGGTNRRSGFCTRRVMAARWNGLVKKARRPSPTESPLLIEIDPEPIPETLTAMGGVPLVVQTFRSLALPASVRQHVRVKERERGYDEATMVESLVVLNAVGGECFDDFQRLREDPGLSEMIGHGIPSPDAASAPHRTRRRSQDACLEPDELLPVAAV